MNSISFAILAVGILLVASGTWFLFLASFTFCQKSFHYCSIQQRPNFVLVNKNEMCSFSLLRMSQWLLPCKLQSRWMPLSALNKPERNFPNHYYSMRHKLVSNYLLLFLLKIVEKIIKRSILPHFDDTSQINSNNRNKNGQKNLGTDSILLSIARSMLFRL